MMQIRVELAERSYPISIGVGLIKDDHIWRSLLGTQRVALVTNETIWPLYGKALSDRLKALGHQVVEIVIADGEAFKTWETLNVIYDSLLAARCDRKTVLIALGGGVVGDLAGFAAATYQRGIDFIQVPTTLLAQVDSSVGGKTGINHPRGKNMIGSFYQPRAVQIDIGVLASLPERELCAGLAEVIKHGAIADAEFFTWIEGHIDLLRGRDPAALSHAIRRSCEIKASVVSRDEREGGIRAILNFGHTFGHAIEAGLGFGTWLHGEAVGAGMVQAARLSVLNGTLAAEDAARIERLVGLAGLPVRAPHFASERWHALMAVDKKATGGEVRFVLLRGLGQAWMTPVSDDILDRTLSETTDAGAQDERSGNA